MRGGPQAVKQARGGENERAAAYGRDAGTAGVCAAQQVEDRFGWGLVVPGETRDHDRARSFGRAERMPRRDAEGVVPIPVGGARAAGSAHPYVIDPGAGPVGCSAGGAEHFARDAQLETDDAVEGEDRDDADGENLSDNGNHANGQVTPGG